MSVIAKINQLREFADTKRSETQGIDLADVESSLRIYVNIGSVLHKNFL